MTSQLSDLDVLKDIPGYKAIMKSVLKSQIQLLLEQLSDNTGEESIILTASVHDGTLSHLGSSTGKGFLEGRDEIKSQFLGYCLKTHHKLKTQETKTPYQRSHPGPRTPAQNQPPMKRPRISPVSLTRAFPGRPLPRPQPKPSPHFDSGGGSSHSYEQQASESDNMSQNNVVIKQEMAESQSSGSHLQSANTDTSDSHAADVSATSFPSSVHLSHTQTSDQTKSEQSDTKSNEQSGELNLDSSSIKIEPISESDMDLEITGVEMADNSMSSEAWGQGQMGYGAEGDGSFDQSGDDQSGYRRTTVHLRTSANEGHHTSGSSMLKGGLRTFKDPDYRVHIGGNDQAATKDNEAKDGKSVFDISSTADQGSRNTSAVQAELARRTQLLKSLPVLTKYQSGSKAQSAVSESFDDTLGHRAEVSESEIVDKNKVQMKVKAAVSEFLKNKLDSNKADRPVASGQVETKTESVFGWKTEKFNTAAADDAADTGNEQNVGLNVPQSFENASEVEPYIIKVENVEDGDYTEMMAYPDDNPNLDSHGRDSNNEFDTPGSDYLQDRIWGEKERVYNAWKQKATICSLNSHLQEKLRNKIKDKKQNPNSS